jgi:hypothetical protein
LNLAFELVQMGANGVSAVAPSQPSSTEPNTQRLSSLLERLDQTLDADGRLI